MPLFLKTFFVLKEGFFEKVENIYYNKLSLFNKQTKYVYGMF